MPIADCTLIEFRVVADRRGNLVPIEGGQDIPFDIKRVYYLFDVPGGAERGGHAHRDLQQIIIAQSGSFDVTIDDGKERKKIQLNRSFYGLLIPRMIWREIDNFSGGAVSLVLASEHYDEMDYFRDYDEFMAAVRTGA